MALDVLSVDPRQDIVEVAGLWVVSCPRVAAHAYRPRGLRSASVELQPLMMSHVVGSIVRSITGVKIFPP